MRQGTTTRIESGCEIPIAPLLRLHCSQSHLLLNPIRKSSPDKSACPLTEQEKTAPVIGPGRFLRGALTENQGLLHQNHLIRGREFTGCDPVKVHTRGHMGGVPGDGVYSSGLTFTY